jgi:hypothetical protein
LKTALNEDPQTTLVEKSFNDNIPLTMALKLILKFEILTFSRVLQDLKSGTSIALA